MPRPLRIFALLDARQLRSLGAFCRRRYRTIDQIQAWLGARGFAVSRGSIGLWRARCRGALPAELYTHAPEHEEESGGDTKLAILRRQIRRQLLNIKTRDGLRIVLFAARAMVGMKAK